MGDESREMIIRKNQYPGVACLFALLAEVIVFYSSVLFSRTNAIPYDIDGYHQPLVGFIASSLRRGDLPLWDPYTYCGVPFYANLQAQLFYPPAWPVFILAAINQHNTFRLLECLVVAHVLLAGALTYLLLRRVGLGRGAALFGGTVFQLGGFFTSQTQHVGAICGTAWMPLAWLGVLLLVDAGSWRRIGLLASALAMAILAGFPATMAAVAGSSILLAVLLVVMRLMPPTRLITVACAIVLGISLSAVELVPAYELSNLSQAGRRGESTMNGGGVPLQALVSMLMPNHYHIFDLDQFQKLHLPWNPLYFYLYCGLAGLGLGLLGVWSKHKFRLVFVGLTVLCAFWMLCDNTPIGRFIFPWLPKAFRGVCYPEFATAAFLLGFSVLAAFAAQRFVAPRGPIVITVLVAVTALDLTHTGANRWMNTSTGPSISYRQMDGSRATLDRMRSLTRETVPPSRVDVFAASHNWAVAAPLFQVPTANGDDPLALWRLLQVRLCFAKGDWWGRYYEVAKAQSPVLSLVNVRFVVSREAALPDGGNFFLRENLADGTHVYENRDVLPRFFVVGQVQRALDLQDALKIMCSDGFDPRRLTVIEGPVPPLLGAPVGGSVRVVRYADRELELEVESPDDAFLVTSEAYFPGWHAWIDGRKTQLVLTNAAFRGLPVPAGHHRVRMMFLPRPLLYGAAVSALAMLVLYRVRRMCLRSGAECI